MDDDKLALHEFPNFASLASFARTKAFFLYMSQVNPNFRVDILFPDEYRDMIAEVYFKDEFVCLITQEDGFESADIELRSAQKGFKFKLAEFAEVLAYAKNRLWELRKTDTRDRTV